MELETVLRTTGTITVKFPEKKLRLNKIEDRISRWIANVARKPTGRRVRVKKDLEGMFEEVYQEAELVGIAKATRTINEPKIREQGIEIETWREPAPQHWTWSHFINLRRLGATPGDQKTKIVIVDWGQWYDRKNEYRRTT